MKHLNFEVLAIVFATILILPQMGHSRGITRTNCKSDRVMDLAMNVLATPLNPFKVRLEASGGSDRSGYVQPYMYQIIDSAGLTVLNAPHNIYTGDAANLRTIEIMNLNPGETYRVILTSRDFCANIATSETQFSLPVVTQTEVNAPKITRDLQVDIFWILLGYSSYIRVFATDDTAMKRVKFKINGIVYLDRELGIKWVASGTGTSEGSTSYEGEQYELAVPQQEQGKYADVEVQLTDVFGNVTTQVKNLLLH